MIVILNQPTFSGLPLPIGTAIIVLAIVVVVSSVIITVIVAGVQSLCWCLVH